MFLIKDLYFVFCRHIVWLSSLDIMAEWTTTKKTFFLPVDCLKSRWVRSYFGLKRLLAITSGKLSRSFSGLINYQELPRFLRFGGNSRHLWLKGKLRCITYATSDYREAETSYLSYNECEATELKQGSELYFLYLRFQYKHTMAKQETIVQIFLGWTCLLVCNTEWLGLLRWVFLVPDHRTATVLSYWVYG